MPRRSLKLSENHAFFEAGSKIENYVSTAPHERIEYRTLQKSRKINKEPICEPAHQQPDFTPKSSWNDIPFLCQNPTARLLNRPSLPKPFYLTS